jgi:hypothetical protein
MAANVPSIRRCRFTTRSVNPGWSRVFRIDVARWAAEHLLADHWGGGKSASATKLDERKRMQSTDCRGELRTLSEEELRQVTGGNSALAAAFKSIFAGINVVVHAIEGLIVKASHNNPSVVAGVNTFNKVGLAVENVAVDIASVV